MRKATYLAVFEPTGDGYAVSFPDLPGCISYGSSFEQAQREAEDALGLHLYGMEKDDDLISPPTATPVIDPETAPGFLVCPVSVYPDMIRNELDNRRVKTNTTLPAWLKDAAEQKGVNYSHLLEAALIDYLGLASHPKGS